jgi:hypothetical protein
MAESTIDPSDADALENPTRGADGRRSAVVSRERERGLVRPFHSIPNPTYYLRIYIPGSIDRSIEPPLLETGKIELKIHQTRARTVEGR